MRNTITIIAAATALLISGLAGPAATAHDFGGRGGPGGGYGNHGGQSGGFGGAYQRHDHGGSGVGTAILGVAAGAAIGAAVSGNQRRISSQTYAGNGYGSTGYATNGFGSTGYQSSGYSNGTGGVTLPTMAGQTGYDASMSNGSNQGYDRTSGYYQQVVVAARPMPRPAPRGMTCMAWDGFSYVPVRRCGN